MTNMRYDDVGMNLAEEAIVDLLEVEGMERLSEKSVFFNFNFRIEKKNFFNRMEIFFF